MNQIFDFIFGAFNKMNAIDNAGVESEAPSKFILTGEHIHPTLKEYCVMTTDKIIQDKINTFKKQSKESLKRTFGSCFRNLTQYTDVELNQHWIDKDEDWDNWCADVNIFYVVRLLLFNKPIPINNLFCNKCRCSSTDKKLQKCSRCNIVRYCSTNCQHSDWANHKKYCKNSS